VHERGLQLVAFTPEHVHRLPAHDARAATLPAADDRFGLVTGFFSLLRQQLGEMRGLEARMDRWGRVEGGHGVEDGVLRRRKHERLAERLEPPVGPVHAHHDAREHAHLATLSA
jgi:hypothetical protein